ncbi:MAG: glycogen synthase GlgA [Planctomycetota bacterium]
MKITFVASEVVPYSKTGGLGDVIGSLPAALAEEGHEVSIISPEYRMVRRNADRSGLELEEVDLPEVHVPLGDFDQAAEVSRGRLPHSEVDVYFLKKDQYYDRPGLYTRPEDESDYQDNSERFIFLCRGALELLNTLGEKPDIIHAHDWQTGLVPVYLDRVYREQFPETASAFTVHNLAYQGLFWHWDMKLTGLPWELFNWKMLEYYGNLSLLKAGLVGGDVVTTVSEQYAREIQTEEYGMGMHGVFRERSGDLFGIVNGVDYRVWDPSDDERIERNYDPDDLSGKAECKRALQSEFELPEEENTPLIGMVGRLVEQKGIDIVAEGMSEILRRGLQVVILGTGEPRYHDMLSNLAEKYPENVGLYLGFDEPMAHRIEAGADMFLMPSRFEPCGLNQLYSLRYGTVPIATATGGLVDTIVDYREDAGTERQSTGFLFSNPSVVDMVEAVDRAVRVYKNDPEEWENMMVRGMRQDWSWKRSAVEYEEVYGEALDRLGENPAD